MLEAALGYGARGWRVFPLTGKRPAIDGGEGYKDATTDADQIREWWGITFPGANIGLACDGEFWALDIDPDKGGDVALNQLEAMHGALPETVTNLTGGDGIHYLFRHNGTPIKNGTNTAGPGLDTRSNGYIVAPPSIHPDTGKPYDWQADNGPDDISIAEAPDWLIALCRKQDRATAPALMPITGAGTTAPRRDRGQ